MTGQCKLLEDVVSNFKGKVYGRKDEWVEVVGDYGNVVAVQSIGGERFSVNKSKLSQGDLQAPVEETIIKLEEPKLQPAKRKPIEKPKVSDSSKQQSIFK